MRFCRPPMKDGSVITPSLANFSTKGPHSCSSAYSTWLTAPSTPSVSLVWSCLAAYNCKTFWMSCTMVSNRSSEHLRIHANALDNIASSSCASCRSRAARTASTSFFLKGKNHCPFSSHAAVMMACSVLLLSDSCCSVFLTTVSTIIITAEAITCKRSFSSLVEAVSLRVATRSQNFLSMATIFSATSRASSCCVLPASSTSMSSSSAAVSFSSAAAVSPLALVLASSSLPAAARTSMQARRLRR
mmetsp:Transcript_27321/g.73863  ORF Transcript_27321/g.73863 Transcript_27321/m.73863 type:complete len:245 (-) Transcript_27321:230-964(-)